MLGYRSSFGFALVKRVRLGRPGTSLKLGLLGMANIGKSSTFNSICNLNVPAQNRPFCTIDPNTAFIGINDERFEGLCKLYNPTKKSGPILRVVDIAGLVKGASQGFGLGNEFLAHVMQVDALYHVVRAFPDRSNEQIAHTEGGMDTVRDIGIIKNQLIKKDIENLDKKLKDAAKKASKNTDPNIKQEYQVLKKVDATLKNSIELRNLQWAPKEAEILNKYLFLTSKPMIYLINLSKKDYLQGNLPRKTEIQALVTMDGKYSTKIIPYSVEHEQSVVNRQKQKSQINNIIKAGYEQLEIIHFYTVGTDEVKAWAIRTGQTAMEAGGKIHSDFTKGFINAEVLHSDILLKNPALKDKLQKSSKKEGKTYIVKDGDILHFNCKMK